MNPRRVAALFAKEWRGYFASPVGFVFIVFFLLLSNGYFFFVHDFFAAGQASMREYFAALPWLLLAFAPALTMRAWAEEKKTGTLELLLTLPLREGEAVLGKYLAALAVWALTLALTWTIPASLFFLGRPDAGVLAASYLGALLLGAACLAVGLWVSSLTESQVTAFVATVAVLFLLLAAGLAPEWFGGRGTVVTVCAYVSLHSHFESVVRGVADTRDAVYYASVIVLFLWLNARTLEARHEARRDARASAGLKTLTVLVLLAVAGVVSEGFWHARVDLTRDRALTLDPAVVRALEGLPDNVTIRVVTSKGLPPEFTRLRTRLVDLLREFEARSGGKIGLVFDSPDGDSLARVAALSLGIEEIVLQEETRAGVKVKKGFFGLALLYRDEKETFPVLHSVETFEYDLVVRLKRLTGAVKTVGVVEGPLRFSRLKARLEPLYRLASQSPDSALDPRADLLLVAAPARLSETEKFRIDQYLMAGKPVLFLTPGADIDFSQGMEAKPARNGYGDLLAHYGAEVRENLLLEPRDWEEVRFGDAETPQPYPYWIRVTPRTLNADNPLTASLPALSFPWASSIAVNPAAQPAARYEVLATTSEAAWEEPAAAPASGEPDLRLYPRALDAYPRPHAQMGGKAHPLVVSVTGPLTSFYAEDSATSLTRSQGDASLRVVSNALFVSDFYADYQDVPVLENNLRLIVGMIDQMALAPDLVRLRSRQGTDTLMDLMDPVHAARFRNRILGLNLVLGPLCVILLGAALAWRRRKESLA
jgi:ABC-2 type transport system permease protein